VTIMMPIEDVRLHAQARLPHNPPLLPLAHLSGDLVDEGCSRRGDDDQSPLPGLLSNRGLVIAAVASKLLEEAVPVAQMVSSSILMEYF
tara:strand:- start:54 stop:320 length:267 start_codon:yes stop_codon:yes gene_type:complete